MALLLFVRSIDDVMPAVEAASEFLAYKQNLEGNRQSDDLLAIWIDDDLEAALPAWSVSRLGTSSERPTTTPLACGNPPRSQGSGRCAGSIFFRQKANTEGNHRAKRLSGRWQRFCLPAGRLPELGRFSRYSE